MARPQSHLTDTVSMDPSNGVLNAMTVDVEEYFQVSAFDHVVDRRDWDSIPSRLDNSIHRVLDLFDECGIHATFFVLGWVAERHPAVIRRIADRGHEIGCHGYDHKLLYRQEPEVFRRETALARRILQDLTGQPTLGYRAASFSIGRDNLWTLDVLVESGFEYDSSIFPILHDRYGIPGAPRHVHRLGTPGGNSILEMPPATVMVGGLTLPVAGGGYLRLLPYVVTRWALKRLNIGESRPAIVYVHPWELDPEQPRLRPGFLSQQRHYGGLGTVERKLRRLTQDYRFGTMRQVIAGLEDDPAPRFQEIRCPTASP